MNKVKKVLMTMFGLLMFPLLFACMLQAGLLMMPKRRSHTMRGNASPHWLIQPCC